MSIGSPFVYLLELCSLCSASIYEAAYAHSGPRGQVLGLTAPPEPCVVEMGQVCVGTGCCG